MVLIKAAQKKSQIKLLFIWENLSRLGGKIISTRSHHNGNFHQQKKFNSYEQKVCPPNRDFTYSWPRSQSRGGMFSNINSFSRLSKIIFFYKASAKKIKESFYTLCSNNNSTIIQTIIKHSFFSLDVSKWDTIRVICCLWASNRCRPPTKHKIGYQALICSNTTKLRDLSLRLCHPFWILTPAKTSLRQAGRYLVYNARK